MKTRVIVFSTNTREHHNFVTITPKVSGLVLNRLRLIDEKEEQIPIEYSRTLESPITIRYDLSIAPLVELSISSSDSIDVIQSSDLIEVKTGFQDFKKKGSMSYSGSVNLSGKKRMKLFSKIEDQGDSCIFADLTVRVVSVSGLGNIESSAFAKISLSDNMRIIDVLSKDKNLTYETEKANVDIFSDDGVLTSSQFQINKNEVIIDLDANDKVYVSYIPSYAYKSQSVQLSDDIILLPDGTIEISNHAHLNGKVYFDITVHIINPPNILRNESPIIKNLSIVTY